MPEEIVIRCVGNMTFSFKGDDIERWNFDFSPEILRIDFVDGSFVEFYKQNIICVAWNKTVR